MEVFDRLRQVPPSAFGRLRHDALIGLGDAAISGLLALSGSIRRISAPAAHDDHIALTVTDRRVVACDEDVVALTLAAADGAQLPPWRPGAHLDIQLPSGRLRQYSLCGDPARRDVYRIAVRRIPDGGGGSAEVHDALGVGTTVTTHGPRNAFPLTLPGYGSPAQRLRFIAGGIGITPILPMVSHAEHFGVDWSMVYAGRSRDSLPFIDELAVFGERVEVRTDDVHGLPTPAELLGECPDETAVYACGPAPMLTGIRAELAGRDNVELHFERFAAPPVIDGEPFNVELASTGATVRVGADETLLSALQHADVWPPYSCRQGFCGTCRTRVLSGRVDHRDTLLTDTERADGMMLICISRAAKGDNLVLDL
ncbi:PDR/VanB family oxidoreductase [Mycobacterium shimoidei]|uniref:PDR/VanB family oxidoreductase n=1 Tax=Mycobacterium shimoidei TaxID=29313 RepID=UPI0008492ED7|nr:PDR/VanB family oxidoreductase [Mycobacterium shimoidei]MCV7258993.1 oxidoreductase [Mycobacterium shimoidei]ODR11578.1 ferredoxin [Mycobacterium shimoidei]ORW76799.1 ferredoxin [Mycobacterium shimoidei]